MRGRWLAERNRCIPLVRRPRNRMCHESLGHEGGPHLDGLESASSHFASWFQDGFASPSSVSPPPIRYQLLPVLFLLASLAPVAAHSAPDFQVHSSFLGPLTLPQTLGSACLNSFPRFLWDCQPFHWPCSCPFNSRRATTDPDTLPSHFRCNLTQESRNVGEI